ncbi:fumarylacetoacetate hydrolase family protein [Rathayibacter sp. KR2-224]|uniref:fumarylacetoacetate hydrolase family protein n=1 Tax=Rathayibacter sp. KR2-224 TaxID=3400913 RepID=UPI003C0EF532
MKIARFSREGALAFGVLDEEEREWVVLSGDPMYSGYETTGERVKLTDATLLAPVLPRSKVIGIGRNYREHAEEMGSEAPAEPLMFLKPNTAVIGPDDAIVLPRQSQRVEHEGELVVVIGRIAKDVTAENALDYVFGYTVGNDVTARDLQRSDGQWARAKGFDTFCPLGPVIETEFDAASASIETRVNGEVRQSGHVADLIHGIPELVSYASSAWTLLPGDVIMTGTPAGVGPLAPGDRVDVTVSGIGTLSNPVRAKG